MSRRLAGDTRHFLHSLQLDSGGATVISTVFTRTSNAGSFSCVKHEPMNQRSPIHCIKAHDAVYSDSENGMILGIVCIPLFNRVQQQIDERKALTMH